MYSPSRIGEIISQRSAIPHIGGAHVVITGGSSGLGAALARHYARDGVRLSLFGRDPARLDAVARSCAELGAAVAVYRCDVNDSDEMKQRLLACDDTCAVDILIANAGVGGSAALSAGPHEDAAAAAQMIQTNVLGVMNTVAPLLPRLRSRGKGSVVIVGSLAGYLGLPESPAYCASKAAARVYGHALRRMLVPHGVRVTVACPGFVETPMSSGLPFRRPFLWSAERAAAKIARGAAAGCAEIAFPLPLTAVLRLSSLLPRPIVDFALARMRARNFP